MKLLIVAMSDSIHTARWLAQIVDQGWDVHLFPSIDTGFVHPGISNTTVHHTCYYSFHKVGKKVRQRGLPVPSYSLALLCRRAIDHFMPRFRAIQLARVIRHIKPDIIHSLEIQHAGYLTLEVRKTFTEKFPPWIVTNWGSDIYLFGRLDAHREKIKEVLSFAEYYSCECQRDACLAIAYGFSGNVLPVFPNAGGFDLEYVTNLRQKCTVIDRRIIMLKGYQTWAGRALVALRALERSSDILKGYTVAIYSATPDVEIAAELFQHTTGIPVVIIPKETSHQDILNWHGCARVSIGLSISDAISTSMLEAMVMGAFPIQSWTSCADEWIVDGINGLLVPPEDPEIVENALRRVLLDDELVMRAAKRNLELANERLGHGLLKEKAVNLYRTISEERHIPNK